MVTQITGLLPLHLITNENSQVCNRSIPINHKKLILLQHHMIPSTTVQNLHQQECNFDVPDQASYLQVAKKITFVQPVYSFR